MDSRGGMNLAQAEMSAQFLRQAMDHCNEAIFRSAHKTKDVSDSEKMMYKNCVKKYLLGPSVFGPSLQNMNMQ